MRLLTIWCLLLATTSFGQDCQTLNNFTSFHGIKFGKIFPDSLRKYCEVGYNKVRADSTFYIWDDIVEDAPIFSEWVNVRLSFSSMAFSAIKDGRIYTVMLRRELNDIDSIYLSRNESPLFFEEVTKELSSLFYKQYKQEITSDISGNAITRIWECEKMSVKFAFTRLGDFGDYILTFTNKELDKLRLSLKYK